MRYFKFCKWIIWYYKNKANLGNDWGRSHESILHLRKSKNYTFNIDVVRIPYGEHTLKYPSHPQAKSSQYANNGNRKDVWQPHPDGAKPKDVIEIPTTCNGMNEKTPHPTQKPEELLRKIVFASSNPNDTILDPFSGSGTTLVVAEQLSRKWLGCDLHSDYNKFAIHRIENIIYRTPLEWLEFDRKNEKRRKSIR
jgi:site-specific DNA-methyltransferase (adenine-specific)